MALANGKAFASERRGRRFASSSVPIVILGWSRPTMGFQELASQSIMASSCCVTQPANITANANLLCAAAQVVPMVQKHGLSTSTPNAPRTLTTPASDRQLAAEFKRNA